MGSVNKERFLFNHKVGDTHHHNKYTENTDGYTKEKMKAL